MQSKLHSVNIVVHHVVHTPPNVDIHPKIVDIVHKL
jgi:hypothetical protein